MKTRIKVLFLLSILMTNSGYAQIDSGKELPKSERGEEIVNQARKAIDKGTGLTNLKSFYIKIDNTIPGQTYSGTEISIVMPDKIRVVIDLGNFKVFKVVNGGKYSEDSEMNLSGEIFSARKMGGAAVKPKVPIYIEEVLSKEKVEYLRNNPDDLNKLFMEDTFWTNVFPILLINPLSNDINYEYIGKAESANQRADIVDVKSDFFRKIRLFFDEKTHLLLMMTKELNRTKSVFTERFYFSDYQLTDGLLVAKSVKRESDEVFKDGSGKKVYNQSPLIIKEIKLNSNLKSGLFN